MVSKSIITARFGGLFNGRCFTKRYGFDPRN